MRSITKSSEGPRGFTLPELIVGVVLVMFFALISIRTVIAAHQLLPGRAVAINGTILPIAPSLSAFSAAVHLHTVFSERIRMARAIYVFGGSHQSISPTASSRSVAPLAAKALPLIESFAAGLPLDAYAFREAYASQLGSAETAADAGDFTVLVIGTVNGLLQVTALAQVRSTKLSANDGASSGDFVRRVVDLYDVSGEPLNYSFLEKAAIAEEEAVGAHHFWYRYFEGRVAEEGPVTVTFPDPWVWSRSGLGAATPALSRFVYCLPISA